VIGGPASAPSAVTDEAGKFQIVGVKAGSYSLIAQRSGFLEGRLGQRSPADTEQWLEISADEKVNVKLTLWRLGVVTGTVRDEKDEPIVGATVRAYKMTIISGRRHLTNGPDARTDDRGQYRITSVQPSTYLVGISKTGWGGTPTGYPPTFFPNVGTAGLATPVEVRSGAEVSSIDITLGSGALVSVSGEIRGLDPPGTRPRVQLIPDSSTSRWTDVDVMETTAKVDGQFTFAAVSPGRYVIRAVLYPRSGTAGRTLGANTVIPNGPIGAPSDAATWFAEQPVSVEDRDVKGLVVEVRSGVRAYGRVVFEGSTPLPPAELMARVPVVVRSVSNSLDQIPLSNIGANGQFHTAGLPPGEYSISVLASPFILNRLPWVFKSVKLGGREIRTETISIGTEPIRDLVITLHDQHTQLRGVVSDPDGRIDTTAAVYAYPTDAIELLSRGEFPRAEFMATGRSDRFGRYALVRLPPGDYFVAAVRGQEPADWKTVRFLRFLQSAATEVRLQQAESRSINLRPREIR
jgi:hypothetical protein